MFSVLSPTYLLLLVVSFLIAIAFHEAAHAYMAVRLGDSTPKREGRLTLNPMAHLDVFGTIAIFLISFGWGRPVRVNPSAFENRRRDMMIVALAGPMANFILAFLGILFVSLFVKISPELFFSGNSLLGQFLTILISLNIFLGVFNLIPLPPLDGGSVLMGIMPKKIAPSVQEFLDAHGQIIFFVLLAVNLVFHIPVITGPVSFVSDYITLFFQMIVAF